MNAIYARQSVDKKDSLSIEGQIDLCQKYAGEEVHVFRDKGYSGKNTKRPAFMELMESVKKGEIQKIYVYRLDRFSRSIADFSKLWEILQQYGVEFQSVTEQFDTSSPMGRAMLNIVLVFAQLERETIAERVKDNYVHRFRLGAWPGGPAPYGFDLTKIMADGRQVSSLAANEQAKVVQAVFEEYAKPDTSLRGIARTLKEKGIHGPKREVWDNVTLSRILHSPLYVKADEDIYWYYFAGGLQMQQDIESFDGVHACNIIGRRARGRNKYNSMEGQMLTVANHEGFIDSDLWIRVQNKLNKNPQIARANAGKYSWLTGLMKCEKCGYAIKINYIKAEDKHNLICSGRSNFAICDTTVQVDLRELENYVADRIAKMLEETPSEANLPDTKERASQILEIEQKINRLVDVLAESSEVSVSYINKKIDVLHKERQKLIKQSENKPPKTEQLDFYSLDFEEKKLVAAQFIDKILLSDENVNIVWRI